MIVAWKDLASGLDRRLLAGTFVAAIVAAVALGAAGTPSLGVSMTFGVLAAMVLLSARGMLEPKTTIPPVPPAAEAPAAQSESTDSSREDYSEGRVDITELRTRVDVLSRQIAEIADPRDAAARSPFLDLAAWNLSLAAYRLLVDADRGEEDSTEPGKTIRWVQAASPDPGSRGLEIYGVHLNDPAHTIHTLTELLSVHGATHPDAPLVLVVPPIAGGRFPATGLNYSEWNTVGFEPIRPSSLQKPLFGSAEGVYGTEPSDKRTK